MLEIYHMARKMSTSEKNYIQFALCFIGHSQEKFTVAKFFLVILYCSELLESRLFHTHPVSPLILSFKESFISRFNLLFKLFVVAYGGNTLADRYCMIAITKSFFDTLSKPFCQCFGII